MDSLIQDEELSHNPALGFLMNQLVNKLATLGQRQNNYAQVDTQVEQSLKIDLNLNLNLIFISISTLLGAPGEYWEPQLEDRAWWGSLPSRASKHRSYKNGGGLLQANS